MSHNIVLQTLQGKTRKMRYILNDFVVEEHVKNALKEDIGFWDITSNAIFDDDYKVTARLNSRVEGILCGIKVVKAVYKILNEFLIFLSKSFL